MPDICASKSSQNGVCFDTISRLWLFRAVLLLAQHYTMHFTTVIIAQWCQCHKRTHFIATNMLDFCASKSSQNGVCFDTISRLWLFRAVLLLAQHYTMHLTNVITARLCQCHKRTHFIATNMPDSCALKSSQNGVCFDTIWRLWLFRAVLLLAQHYTMHFTTVITARLCQCHK
jgi:predicted neuraminidase